MNKLLTQVNGGWPLKLDDIRWMDESIRESFKAVFAMFPQDRVIVLSGLGIPSGVNNTVPAGYVYYAGEIYVVDETDIGTYTNIIWDFTPEMSSTSGQKTLQSGTDFEAHEIRKGKLLATALAAGDIPAPVRRYIVDGEVHQHTIGFYDTLAANFDLVPAGSMMLWGGTLANIPAGWELAIGQMGFFGGAFPSMAPDMRRCLVAGYDATAAAPFNALNTVIDNIDLNIDPQPLRMRIGAWIIKNGSVIPPIFSY
jgi:hypothetical protein